MKKVTKFTSFLIIPLGILLFLEAFVMRSELVDSAILSSSAASASQVRGAISREHWSGFCRKCRRLWNRRLPEATAW